MVPFLSIKVVKRSIFVRNYPVVFKCNNSLIHLKNECASLFYGDKQTNKPDQQELNHQ